MRERPILFSAPMVRAILGGKKTQTRRVVKTRCHRRPLLNLVTGTAIFGCSPGVPHEEVRCPYGVPGDRLTVKEAAWMWCERRPNGLTATAREKYLYVPLREAPVVYAAEAASKPRTPIVSPDTGNPWGWRLKIGRFLPRWASRITLEVTGVRVERLQDISNRDAMAEGIAQTWGDFMGNPPQWALDSITEYGAPGSHLYDNRQSRENFQLLWESIHGTGSWDANPWVWVVSFKRVEAA